MDRRYWLALLIGMVFSFSTPANATGIAMDASVGSLMPAGQFSDPNLDFTGHLWYKFDQMVFFGASSGIQTMGRDRHIPMLASMWLRLPFGGQILPVGTADWGYHFGDAPQFVWKLGGGLDIKNGDRSSILVLGGYQKFRDLGGYYYMRAGLLLEF